MFLMRNKENSSPICILIWRPVYAVVGDGHVILEFSSAFNNFMVITIRS